MRTPTEEPRIYGELTRYASVRHGFTQYDEWHAALQDWRRGVNVPLRVAVTDGPLDAPEWMPAGCSYSTTKRGPSIRYAARSA